MDKLEQKYRNDNLTPEELKRLREEVNSTGNARLEDSLRETWEAAEVSPADTLCLDELKAKIDKRLFSAKHIVPLYWKVLRIAAAVLLPLLYLCIIVRKFCRFLIISPAALHTAHSCH